MPFTKGHKLSVGNKGGRKKLSEELLDKVKERTFKEIMKELIPDRLLAEKHLELLTVPRKIRSFGKGDNKLEVEEVDSQAISKGLDMAYKLKGEYAPEKKDISITDFNKILEEI